MLVSAKAHHLVNARAKTARTVALNGHGFVEFNICMNVTATVEINVRQVFSLLVFIFNSI